MSNNFDLFTKILGQTSPHPMGIEVSKAKGAFIYDEKNNAYLDFIAGVAVSNIGHGHPKVLNAITKQAQKYLHVMVYGEFIQPIQIEFAQNLISFLPQNLNAVYPVNSGTEANEAAIKLARRATGKSKIIAARGAYHGNTLGSLSISSNEKKKYKFRPLLPDVHYIEFNNAQQLELIDENTACVIIETIQADAGVRIPSSTYMHLLSEKCKKTNTLLIFDEIQCGMGRTGKMFAFEHFGVTPDILTLGKALGGGLPIGALVANQKLLHLFSNHPILGHITTFGGNPLILAAANATLEVFKTEIDLTEVEKKGKYIEQNLYHKVIKEIRRKGLMFAIEFENAEIVSKIVTRCLKEKVITFWFLSCPESFRIAPPLNISYAEIDQGLNVINRVIEEVALE